MFREYKDVLAPIPSRLHSKVKDLRLNRTIIARRINALSFDFPSDRSVDNNIHSSLNETSPKKEEGIETKIYRSLRNLRTVQAINFNSGQGGRQFLSKTERKLNNVRFAIHSFRSNNIADENMKTRGKEGARFSFPSPLFRFGCLPPSPPLSPRSSKPLLSGWLRGVRTSVTHGLGRHEHREMISP